LAIYGLIITSIASSLYALTKFLFLHKLTF